MKHLKPLGIILTVAMIGTLFTACAPKTTPAASSVASSAASSSAAVKSPDDYKGEVNMLAWLPDNPDIVTNWVAAFQKKYKNVKVNAQMMTGQGLVENLEPRFAANNIPDVFSFELDSFSHSQVTAGKIADVGDTKAWAEQVPAMQASWTFGGVKYGISGGIATTLFYYNMDAFTKAGITTLPKNWDEFLAMCEKLKTAGVVPLVWYGGFPNMLSNGPLSWGFANDIMPLEKDVIKNVSDTKYDFSKNAGWLKMYQKMKILDTKGYLVKGFTSTDYNGGQDQFNNQAAAMIFAGTWQAAYLIDKGSFKTGLFLPPWNDAGKDLVAVNASETGWSVGKNNNIELGKLLLDNMFYDNFNIYQNPRGSVSPFKTTTGNVLNAKLGDAVAALNKITTYTDLFARNLPTAISTEAMTDAQGIYIDKTPEQIPALLTKVQNEYFATK